jgi:hypothetical protein
MPVCPNIYSDSWKSLVNDIKDKYNVDDKTANEMAEHAFYTKGEIPESKEAFEILDKAFVTSTSKSIKQNIKDLFNRIVKRKPEDVGYRMGIAEGKKKAQEIEEARKKFVEEVKDYLKNNENLRGKLSEAKIDAIVNKAAKIGSSEKAFNKFTDYVDKVIKNENYSVDLKNISSSQKKMKTNWKKGMFISVSDKAARLMNFDPSTLEPDQAAKMAQIMNEFAKGKPNTAQMDEAIGMIPEPKLLEKGEETPDVITEDQPKEEKEIDYTENDNQYYDSIQAANDFISDYEGYDELKKSLDAIKSIDYEKAKELLSKNYINKLTHAISELENGNITAEVEQVVSEYRKQDFKQNVLKPYLESFIPDNVSKVSGSGEKIKKSLMAYFDNSKNLEKLFDGSNSYQDILDKIKTYSDSMTDAQLGVLDDFWFKNLYNVGQTAGQDMSEMVQLSNSISAQADEVLLETIKGDKGVIGSISNFIKKISLNKTSKLKSILEQSIPSGNIDKKLSNETKLDIAKNMVGIVMHQLDYMANSGKIEGKPFEQQLEKDRFKRGHLNNQDFEDYINQNLSNENKKNIEPLLAYAMLTDFGKTNLGDLTKDQLLGKLSKEQVEYMNKIREALDSHAGKVTSIMMRNGKVSPLLADYAPRFREGEGFDAINGNDDKVFSDMAGYNDNSLHMSAAQVKSRQNYDGAVDLDPSRILRKTSASIAKDYYLTPYAKENLGALRELKSKKGNTTQKENNISTFSGLVYDRELSKYKAKINLDRSVMSNEIPALFRAVQKPITKLLLVRATRQFADVSGNIWNTVNTYGIMNTMQDLYNKVSKENPAFIVSPKESENIIDALKNKIPTLIISKVATQYDILAEGNYTREEAEQERKVNWQDLRPISGYWATMFKKSFYEATKKEFNLKEFESNPDFYLNNFYEDLSKAAYKADYETQKSFSDLTRFGTSESVSLGFKNVDRNSVPAMIFGFMLNYQAHQYNRMKRAIGMMGTKELRGSAVKDLAAVAGSEYVYLTVANLTSKILFSSVYSVIASIFPNDKEKRKQEFQNVANMSFMDRKNYQFGLLKDNFSEVFSNDFLPNFYQLNATLFLNPRLISTAKPLIGLSLGQALFADKVAAVGKIKNRKKAAEAADEVKQEFYKYRNYGITPFPAFAGLGADKEYYDKAVSEHFQNEFGGGFFDFMGTQSGAAGAIGSETASLSELSSLVRKSVNGETTNPDEAYTAAVLKSAGIIMAFGGLNKFGSLQSLAGDANKLSNSIVRENKSIERGKTYKKSGGKSPFGSGLNSSGLNFGRIK